MLKKQSGRPRGVSIKLKARIKYLRKGQYKGQYEVYNRDKKGNWQLYDRYNDKNQAYDKLEELLELTNNLP